MEEHKREYLCDYFKLIAEANLTLEQGKYNLTLPAKLARRQREDLRTFRTPATVRAQACTRTHPDAVLYKSIGIGVLRKENLVTPTDRTAGPHKKLWT